MKSLQETFDPRRNAMNSIRLAFAIGVIGWHSFPLSGHDDAPAAGTALRLGDLLLDGFFAISGYLILSSWTGHPQWWHYLRARLLRVLPGFYVCMIATAVVFAPLSVWIAGGSVDGTVVASGASYVLVNSLMWIQQWGISGTLTDVPYQGVWNGSLWTLFWEFVCYLGILALGLLRLLRFRLLLPVLFVLATVGLVAVLINPTGSALIDPAPRVASLFLAGALVFQFRDKLPVSWPLIAAATVVVAAATLLPAAHRIPVALPMAYAVISFAAMVKAPRFRLKNDLSYGTYIYAFPVQQILATMGGMALGVAGFFLVATVITLPLAAASWFLIERPALRLKNGRTKIAPAAAADTGASIAPAPVHTAGGTPPDAESVPPDRQPRLSR